MKKILFMINSLANGGAERALVNLVNSLPKDDYEITLFTLYSSNIFDKDLDEKIRYKYLFKEKNRLKKRILLALLCRIIPKKILHRILFGKKYDYEIAFLQGFPTDLIGSSCNKRSQKIAFIHSDFSTNYDVNTWYKNPETCASAYRKFNKICFVSKTVQEGFHKIIDGTFNNEYVIHNVNDSEGILKMAEESSELYSTENLIVSIGRLIPLKAFDRIVDAVKILRNEGVHVQCWIVGDGPDKEHLQNLIDSNNLQGYVRLLGYQKNPYKFLKQADLYVCSSTTEGYNTATVEAIILGIPILTTEVSGAEEIIADTKCGIIVDNSMDGVYNGLKQLFTHEEDLKQMKLSAANRSAQFATKEQINEFLSMLEDNQ